MHNAILATLLTLVSAPAFIYAMSHTIDGGIISPPAMIAGLSIAGAFALGVVALIGDK